METPQQALKRMRNGPRPVIGCLPLYPPLELFHSLGLTPIVLWELADAVSHDNDADRHIQNYTCAVCRRLTQFVIREWEEMLDGLFFYNACDTLRNLPEILREGVVEFGGILYPQFRLHVPMTTPAQADASDYLKKEIERLVVALEEHYGVSFSEDRFAESVALYDRMRELCRQLERAVASGRMMFADFCRVLTTASFLEVNEQIVLLESTMTGLKDSPASLENPARLIVSGILPPPTDICKMMDQAGLLVAGNDIACFYRSYSRPPETWTDMTDYYVQFYRDHFPCTTLLYTADRRVETILELVSDRKAQGFMFVGEKFCECEYFEWPYLEKQLRQRGIPSLSLEISMDDNTGMENFRTRLEAFKELLDA